MAQDYSQLITSEHNDKPLYMSMVQQVTAALGQIVDAGSGLPVDFDIDTAAGVQLDQVGVWVGQSRLIPNVLFGQYFGFDGYAYALAFGEEGNASFGGRFYNEGEPTTGTTILADPEYRLLLKAKIVKNQSKGTTADINQAVEYLFGAKGIVYNPGDMTYRLAIGKILTLVEIALITNLDVLPRPAGVRISSLEYYDQNNVFGFSDQPGAKTFGEETQRTYDGSWVYDGSVLLNGTQGTISTPYSGAFAEEMTL